MTETSESPEKHERRSLLPIVMVIGLTVAAVAWAMSARAMLHAGHRQSDDRQLTQSIGVFDYQLEQLQERVKSVAWLMGEDPRLRSALATPGMDEQTIVDLLNEMKRPTGSQLIAVLNPQGRVQAVVGDDTFAGADLSTSRFVRGARESDTPVIGHWPLGTRLFSIAAYAVRLGDRVIAYLIHGAEVDVAALTAAHQTTGTAIALVMGGKVALRAPALGADTPSDEAFAQVARLGSNENTLLSDRGLALSGKARSVEGSLPPAHIVWLRPRGQVVPEYEYLDHLVWAPVLLCVAMALLFAHRILSR